MKNVLVIGSGKSTGVLIDYLLETAAERDWRIRVVDRDIDLARRRVGVHHCGEAMGFEAEDEALRDQLVSAADIVVSMLPPWLHPPVARACVHFRKHFVSASYVSPEIQEMQQDAERSGVTLLSEMGVDPGIDHMFAKSEVDALMRNGARIRGFETFTGGLVAPESDDNPWHYKFTWNPRNVVIAGQGGVKFKQKGRHKYIPYHNLFRRYQMLQIPEYGSFEGYPNRDSLKYRRYYGLHDVDTICRGTLRRPGFCDAWHCLVSLGLTDDSFELEELDGMTYRDLINSFLPSDAQMNTESEVRTCLGLEPSSPVFNRLEWLGLFERRPVGLRRGTPAQVLQKLLEEKWVFGPNDRDMIAMLQRVEYEIDGQRHRQQCSMVTIGDDVVRTAMAKTVGLAVGIGAKLLLEGEIKSRGVVIPTVEEVYAPVLRELTERGIAFCREEPEHVSSSK